VTIVLSDGLKVWNYLKNTLQAESRMMIFMIAIENVRIVLVRTTHPGNIGAAARAMKNMGFSQLYLVQPQYYPHLEATTRCSGAEDLLATAVVADSIAQAISGCHLIFGTSARSRALPWPLLNPRECANKVKTYAADQSMVAILFGQERSGLSNDELALCHYHLHIPCNPNFSSLNLAAAVQVVTYELRMALMGEDKDIGQDEVAALASAEQIDQFYKHLEETLIKIGFLNPANPRRLMRKLHRLYNRVLLEQNEINILRGILSAINQMISNKEKD
jgi:tRNA (cytidine32/uridine32-2'-O)-methyltransferase